jgi:pyridoxal biosynthesis lyase PdxS
LIPPTNNNEDNGWSEQAPSLREVDIVAEVRLKVLTSKPQVETCDVFDVLKVDFIDDVEDMTLADMVYGVTKIDGVVIPEDD